MLSRCLTSATESSAARKEDDDEEATSCNETKLSLRGGGSANGVRSRKDEQDKHEDDKAPDENADSEEGPEKAAGLASLNSRTTSSREGNRALAALIPKKKMDEKKYCAQIGASVCYLFVQIFCLSFSSSFLCSYT